MEVKKGKSKEPNKKLVAFRIRQAAFEKLQELAKHGGCSQAYLIEQFIEESYQHTFKKKRK